MRGMWVGLMFLWVLLMAGWIVLISHRASAFDGTPTEAQYGPPIRYPDPRDWGPDERARRMPPPRGGYDLPPHVRDCIAYGRCAGSRPRMPPFPGPPDRYDLYEGE